jgi:hypothetical protein
LILAFAFTDIIDIIHSRQQVSRWDHALTNTVEAGQTASRWAATPDGGIAMKMKWLSRIVIARLNPDGSLDTAFDPGTDGRVYALAVQEDGRIVVGAVSGNLAGKHTVSSDG